MPELTDSENIADETSMDIEDSQEEVSVPDESSDEVVDESLESESIEDAANGSTSLPLAPEATSWDGSGAISRIKKWASDADGNIDWAKYGRAFFWVDSSDKEKQGSYKLPFADVIDGKLTAVWNGVHAAMGALKGARNKLQIPEADKKPVYNKIKSYYGKFNKPVPPFESLESEDIELTDNLNELLAMDASDIVDEKIKQVAHSSLTQLEDTFTGTIVTLESLTDSAIPTYRFKAITGQVDKANGNKRIYPKEELLKNMPRVNRLMKRGGFTGYAGHPGLFDGGSPRDICVKFTSAEIDGNNVIQCGELVSTDAGRDIAVLWDAGVELEWSWRGWGKAIPADQDEFDKKGWQYDGNWIISDYIWEGADIVSRGAAKTKTIELSKEGLNLPPTPSEDETPQAPEEVVNESLNESEIIEEEVSQEEPQVESDSEEQPQMDTQETPETTQETTPKFDDVAIQKLVAEETKKQLDAALLRQHKDARIAELVASDAEFADVLKMNIDAASSIEDVDSIFNKVAPKLSAMKLGANIPTGIAVIDKRKTAENNWIINDNVASRPDTIAGVKNGLLEGLEDKKGDPKREIFEKILDNYEKSYPNYLYACTKRGYMETATTTTALSTTVPQVLPLLRKLYPKLISYEIATVMPINAPTARVYTMDTVVAGTSNSLSDSSVFDSSAADHVENNTKMQISPKFTYADITATEKAIYFDLTSALIQDMAALHNIDAQAELLGEAANEIARELNYTFLNLLLSGATAGSTTYGTTKPTGYTSDLEWYRMLALYIAKVGGWISESVYTPANYMVISPDFAPLLVATSDYIKFPVPTEYGAGLRGTGTFSSDITVFVAEWFTANTMLLIAKGDTWLKSGAVFAPYIPLFISPVDYVPSINTLSRSVTSRNGMTVLNGKYFGRLTKDTSAGVAPF